LGGGLYREALKYAFASPKSRQASQKLTWTLSHA
jgi:hypothetical protein